jgi:hypothetical protein
VGEKTKLYKTKPTRQPADSSGPELYFRKKWEWAGASAYPTPFYKTN